MKKRSFLLLTVSFVSLLQSPGVYAMDSKGDLIQQDSSHLKSLLQTVDQNIPSSLPKAVFVFGQTGTGKSTLINALSGVPLVVKDGLPLAEIVVKGGYAGSYASIGDRTTSQTTLPQMYGPYCDCPGYNDSKGESQNISNGYAIHKTLQALGKNGFAQFMLVVSDTDLGDRKDGLLQTIHQMAHSFDSLDHSLDSVSLVVTKNQNWDINSLTTLLKKILVEGVEGGNVLLTDKTKSIFHFFSQNPDHICFFPQPDEKLIGQDLPREWSQEILKTLETSQWTQNLSSKMDLSPGSKLLLKNLWDSFLQESDLWMKDTFSGKLAHYTQEEIQTSAQSLKNLRSDFSALSQALGFKNLTCFQAFDYLEELCQKAKDGQTLSQIQGFQTRLQFLANLDSSLLQNPYEFKGLTAIRDDLQALSQSPKIDSTSHNLTAQGLLIGASDLSSFLTGRHFNEISIYALNTFLIDANLTDYGSNMSVLAPYWRVVSSSTFDLSGNPGRSQSQSQASLGSSGLPGFPGGSGGNFYGKGTVFKGLNQLTLNVSGGKGGKGQQGGDGKNGRDGGDFQYREAQSSLERDVKRSRSDKLHMISSEEVKGFWGSLSRTVLTGGNKKYEEVYEISLSGEEGDDSHPGGVGGLGGFPGKVILEKGSCKDAPSLVQNQGPKGDNGSPGNPGKGGRYGIYRGTYLNEYMLADARIDQYATDFWDVIGKSLKSSWGTVTAPIGAFGASISSEWKYSPSFYNNSSKRASDGKRNWSLNESPLESPQKPSNIPITQKSQGFLKIKDNHKGQPGYRRFALTL